MINMKAKKKKVILIIVFITLIFFCIFFVVSSNLKLRAEQEKQQKIFNEEKEIVINVVEPIASKYDINDYEYDHLVVTSFYGIVYVKIDDYQKLSNIDKLLFLSDLSLSVYKKKDLFPNDSEAEGKNMEFNIITKEHTYYDFITSSNSWLMEDGNKIFEMETDYAKEVNQSLNSMLYKGKTGSSYNGYSYEERNKQCSKTWGNSWCYEINRRYNCVALGYTHYNNCKCVSSCK